MNSFCHVLRAFLIVLFFLFGTHGVQTLRAEPEKLVLENASIRLEFDSKSGLWTGLKNRSNGWEYVAAINPKSGVVPVAVPSLNTSLVERAIVQGEGISLLGEWFYTSNAVDAKLADRLADGDYGAATWLITSVPGRRGVGDDRLMNRVGDFWYRRDFFVPTNFPQGELVLIMGAVDDFDVAYINQECVGTTGIETPHHWEAPRVYRFPSSLIHRGKTNVLSVKVTNGSGEGGIAGPVVIGLAGTLTASEDGAPMLVEHVLDNTPGTNRLKWRGRSGNLEYSMEYCLKGDEARLSRQLSIRNVGNKEELIQNVIAATPSFSVGNNQSFVFPGSLPCGDQPMRRLRQGESMGPRSQEPLVVLWDGERQSGLGCWDYCEEEFTPVTVRRLGSGLEIRHTQGIIIRLKPGASVSLGRQYFWLNDGNRDAVIGGIQDVYKSIGLHAPERGLDGLRGMVLYCGHPGGVPELGFTQYGGFNALRAYTPTLKQMGVDLVWLLPIWEHGDGTKWNLYGPLDPFQVSPLYGTPSELKAFSAELSKNGMHLMFDLVPHGPPEVSKLAQDHPEFAVRDIDGKIHFEWGQLAFDNAHPGWQAMMGKAAEWGGREFGAVGARVDCGAGGPVNWNRDVTDRPSLSTLAGGLGMNRAIRDGYLRVQSQVVLLPEEYTGANVFYRVSDLTYDAQLYFLFMDLKDRNATPAEWVVQLRQFLHDQKMSLPPGGLKMRWISNHDTVSWTFQKKRPQAIYGVEFMRALMALCAVIDGVPMIYQGDENPAIYRAAGPASVEFLGRIHACRKRLAGLHSSHADYVSVEASNGVFACVRGENNEMVIPLISLNTVPVRTVVKNVKGAWRDELSGDIFSQEALRDVPMAAGQVRVLVPKQ